MRIKELNALLLKIDQTILSNLEQEQVGLLYGSGGCSLYFCYRNLLSPNPLLQNAGIESLERIIAETNLLTPNNLNFSDVSVTPMWLIDQLIKRDLLDAEEKDQSREMRQWISESIESTTSIELVNNNHDLFYGYIGKAIILMENDEEGNKSEVKKIISTLMAHAVRDQHGVYWETPYPFYPSIKFEKTINFGIPHGTMGIILFLLKCCEVYHLHHELQLTLERSIDWIIYLLDKENNKLLHVKGNSGGGMGRLAWCYGDLAISYTLLRYDEVFGYPRSKEKAYQLIHETSARSMSESGIPFFAEYDFYDIGLCHGTSSVAYMYKKMAEITNEDKHYALADAWLSTTIENVNKFLPQIDAIRAKGKSTIDTGMGFLEGLSGVGLVLIAFLNPELSDWDKLLLLDRRGKVYNNPNVEQSKYVHVQN